MSNQFNLKSNSYFDRMEKALFNYNLPNNNMPTSKIPDIKPVEDDIDIKGGKQKKSFGRTVAITIASIAAAVLLVTKGISGSTAERIRRYVIKAQNNFLRFAAKNKTADGIEKQMFRSAKYSKKMLEVGDAVGNITAVKDTLFHKITSFDIFGLKKHCPKLHNFLNKYIPIQKVCDWFTKNILKITYGAVDTKYSKAANAFENLEAKMMSLLEEARKKGASVKDIKFLQEKINSIAELYRAGFGKTVRNQRLAEIHRGLNNLADDVSAEIAGTFKRKSKGGKGVREIYGSYMTERLASPTKNAHKHALDTAKIKLSNNVSDVYSRMTSAANDLTYSFNVKDTQNRQLFGDLLQLFEDFKKHTKGSDEKIREKLKNDILATLSQLRTNIEKASSSGMYTPEEAQKMYGFVSNVKNAANTAKRGHVQEILGKLKEIFGAESKEYISIKASTNKANDLLNSAIEAEGNNLVSKIAESKVGSIPTDVVGLATPIIGGALVISKGKDKNEKIAATLKGGIPILGFVASYFYTASKAFSGAKNLLFGAVTTFILNRIGTAVYNYYQKRFVENKSVKDIAKDAYENVTSI